MNAIRTNGRPRLALVSPPAAEVMFCGHCGSRPRDSETISPTRVCAGCGLGLLLQCAQDAAPKPGDAFLVLDHTLAVCAVSAAAERLLATPEMEAVNAPIGNLLVPADAEGNGEAGLAAAIIWASRGDGGISRTVVRPTNVFGVRLSARIAGCGPPRAALLVFE